MEKTMEARNAWWRAVVGGIVGTLLWVGLGGAQPFPGGLPACQDRLQTCTAQLGICEADLAECLAGPHASFCGDGIVDAAAGEQCDDGGESATCNWNCTFAVCGDGIVNVTAGERCEPSVPSACPDGFVCSRCICVPL